MGLSEKDICIKCDKGGEVLACADRCCPIAVHVRCMGCPARFDDSGKFYCPYCLYRQSIAKFHQAKEHVLSKKQALHTFIDKEMIDNVREVPSIASKSTCESADEPLAEKKSDVPESNCDQQLVVGQQIHSGPDVDCGSKPSVHTSSKATATDSGVLEAGKSVQVNDLQEVGEHQLENIVEDSRLSNSSVAEEDKSGNELVLAETKRNSAEITREQMIGVDQTTETVMNTDPPLQQHVHGKRKAETGDLKRGESKSVSTQRECGQKVNKVKGECMLTDSPRRLTRTSASLLKKSSAAGELVQVKQHSILLPVILPNGKRRRVLWSREEEEMIEEGVQKFASTVNKNIPWRKILEFGRHVFDHTRTPTDLKDKWKQICSKYGGRV
ncbi:protein CHROMATIN REMODELING 4-like [Lycium barbarum]|uniref:protein CHROMATIN REMODELING 4-like n=1 Tax=Lycium barbarum TaxID=112863 RepID=UPI00293F44C3|nr:protein CHROMATIN REMODELING 4-like [Lycium barbarum]XP_060187258.1 protein CHROMATIN REMODELING 4-like [Lycium barbarum]XP_060187259.1 protein CHROMATIN REMODELING 4-like [Lycium barbarum]